MEFAVRDTVDLPSVGALSLTFRDYSQEMLSALSGLFIELQRSVHGVLMNPLGCVEGKIADATHPTVQ